MDFYDDDLYDEKIGYSEPKRKHKVRFICPLCKKDTINKSVRGIYFCYQCVVEFTEEQIIKET